MGRGFQPTILEGAVKSYYPWGKAKIGLPDGRTRLAR